MLDGDGHVSALNGGQAGLVGKPIKVVELFWAAVVTANCMQKEDGGDDSLAAVKHAVERAESSFGAVKPYRGASMHRFKVRGNAKTQMVLEDLLEPSRLLGACFAAGTVTPDLVSFLARAEHADKTRRPQWSAAQPAGTWEVMAAELAKMAHVANGTMPVMPRKEAVSAEFGAASGTSAFRVTIPVPGSEQEGREGWLQLHTRGDKVFVALAVASALLGVTGALPALPACPTPLPACCLPASLTAMCVCAAGSTLPLSAPGPASRSSVRPSWGCPSLPSLCFPPFLPWVGSALRCMCLFLPA